MLPDRLCFLNRSSHTRIAKNRCIQTRILEFFIKISLSICTKSTKDWTFTHMKLTTPHQNYSNYYFLLTWVGREHRFSWNYFTINKNSKPFQFTILHLIFLFSQMIVFWWEMRFYMGLFSISHVAFGLLFIQISIQFRMHTNTSLLAAGLWSFGIGTQFSVLPVFALFRFMVLSCHMKM